MPVESSWTPFRYTSYTVLWTATVVSNIGTWMYNAGSGWMMTSLNADPLIVSLVQVATSLPMFLFAMPAGALSDIVDRRLFLVIVTSATTVIATVIAILVAFNLVTPSILILFTFLLGTGAALTAPTWRSIIPQLVPRDVLAPAVAADSMGINISRAVGPAVGGLIIASIGIASPFWLNAISNLEIIVALLWWRPGKAVAQRLPAELFVSAMITGVRHARYNSHLRATLMRTVGFILFASAYWALLPLVARSQIAGGPELYGFLLGVIGTSAVIGAFVLPWIKERLGTDRLVAAGTIGTAVTLVLFGLAREPSIGLLASSIAGVSWITVLASLSVSAQVALPDWVRGRGLATFVTVLFGAMTFGSAAWGQIAGLVGLPDAHFLAAAGVLISIPLTWRWKLQTGAGVDLTPSMHWPTPVLTHRVEYDQGPVLVTIEYHVEPRNREAFLAALKRLSNERRRDGAYAWYVFEDTADQGRFLETFMMESWLEHLRQHGRVTNADRIIQDAVNRYHASGAPQVTHFVAAEAREQQEEQ
ncbi:MFS permease [Methanosarcina siciliae HI350]|uniref:MFS permease n=1 Tax=Methanosarcina siciliae HI350 TaxID=1434119 RepID=A0A0E3PAS9_9EURY|nr:MFS transporter [Methanosarcina siciliae]AKB31194.1 MFS permease [Methanosarcina siciliae HI350]